MFSFSLGVRVNSVRLIGVRVRGIGRRRRLVSRGNDVVWTPRIVVVVRAKDLPPILIRYDFVVCNSHSPPSHTAFDDDDDRPGGNGDDMNDDDYYYHTNSPFRYSNP